MSFHRWLQSLQSALAPGRRHRKHKRRGSLRAATRRPCLEVLEDRCLLSFSPVVNYAAGENPQAVVAGHFNNDTVLDLAVANTSGSTVSVLLGNANGTFQGAVNYATAAAPQSVAVGDFNEDGKLDLVTANASDVSVLLGNGDGTLQPAANLNVGSGPASVAVGDFNGDGKMDLGVTSNVYYPGNYYPGGPAYYGGWYPGYYGPGHYEGRANVLLGNGAGEFSDPSTTGLGYGFHRSAAAADFNGDHNDDFATVNSDYGMVSVLLGNDDPLANPLGASTGFTTGWYPQAVTVGEFTGDDILDLATAGQSVDILPGYGDGTFNPVVRQFIDPVALAAADFNDDGNLDLVTANYGDTVIVLLGSGDGTLWPPLDVATGAAGAAGVAVGDFNGDGRPDVASANASSGNVSVLLNDGVWPTAWLEIGDVTVTEGNTGTVVAQFIVTLSAPSTETVTVNYATFDASATTAEGDYQSVNGTLIFNPGDPLTQTIPVFVNGDRRGEWDETFVVNITSTEALVADGQGIGTISDDEPLISIGDASVAEGNSGTTALNFLVTLSAIYDADVSVSFATQDGSATTADQDYQTASGTATIAAGSTTTTVTINVNGDDRIELDEAISVNLSNPAGARIDDGVSVGTIRNDDSVKFYVVDSSSDSMFEYGATGQAVGNYSLGYGNNDPRGAASYVGGDRVWGIDNDDYVDVYDAAGIRLGYWKAKGLQKPEGIASDGTDIWIVDRGRDRVYRYAGAASRTWGSVSPTSSFALAGGNKNARGIETDGTHLWVVNDASTNKVFKYTLSGSLVGSWTISGANQTPTGITLDPSNPSDVWIVDAGRDQVFQYTAAAGRTGGSQSPGAVFNLAPGNTNPQGIADPPPPAGPATSPTESGRSGEPSRTVAAASPAPLVGDPSIGDGLLMAAAVTTPARLARDTAGDELHLPGGPRAPEWHGRGPAITAAATPITPDTGDDMTSESNDRSFLEWHKAWDAVFADLEGLGTIRKD